MVADTSLLLGLALVTVVAAAVHSALGFGSGPLLVPVLLFAFDPSVAVLSAVLVGMVVNLLQLTTEGRRPSVPARRLLPLWLGAVPGCVAGALLLPEMPVAVLSVVIAVALLLSAASLFFTASVTFGTAPPARLLAGAMTGASAALTGIFGPLLGVILIAGGERGQPLRDGLGASFLVVGATAVVASLAVTGAWSAFAVAGALIVPAALGYALGRRGAGLLSPVRQRRAVLLAVLAGAIVSLARVAG